MAWEEGRVKEIAFEDQDLAFNEELMRAGVKIRDLKRPPPKRVVQAWLTEEEKVWNRKEDPVHEAKLLKKLGGLNFYDTDKELPMLYSVHTGNLE